MLLTKSQVNWPFGSGEQAKNRFSSGCHDGHFGISIGMILGIFDLQVTPMLLTKFQELAQRCRRSRLSKQIVNA